MKNGGWRECLLYSVGSESSQIDLNLVCLQFFEMGCVTKRMKSLPLTGTIASTIVVNRTLTNTISYNQFRVSNFYYINSGKESCSKLKYLYTGHFPGELYRILDKTCLISIPYNCSSKRVSMYRRKIKAILKHFFYTSFDKTTEHLVLSF